MSLNLQKLTKVRRRPNGTLLAQCPACAAAGQDRQGQHLVVYPDGRFGCAVHPGPEGRPHRQEIWRLAGERAPYSRPPLVLKFTVKPKT
ncbi:MAG TPA: hypothetical protein VNZ22_12255 [Bacillota bacterium]|nr:hypothetical protein [Bacillota bacterium]